MSNLSNQKITFWQFLTKHKIEVPIIQRDFAQGRIEKSELRHNFLSQLYSSLLNKKEIKLDFVYGSVENGIFYPLDGQQRLTTLWLIHLFIAFKAQVLSDVKDVFLHFTYETRVSSSEFCKHIVMSLSGCKGSNGSIKEYVYNQTWYYLHYDQDPTIQSMLRMISGDTQEDLTNGIEQIFKIDQATALDFWELLTGPNTHNCPIKFYYRGMQDENMPLCDDLYIKMNARGKQLTHFENFKAELLGSKVHSGKDLFNIGRCQKDQEFISRIDNQWTDLFWPYRHQKLYRVDEIMFKFVNRVLLNYLICHSHKKELQKDPLFQKLYGYPDSKDPKIFHPAKNEFGSIDIYAPTINYGMKKKLQYLFLGLEKLSAYTRAKGKTVNEFFQEDFAYYFKHSKEPFSLIPEYTSPKDIAQNDNMPVSGISQLDRILFHAICCYLIQLGRRSNMSINIDNLLDWIRVIYNVSSDVNTVDGMISDIRFVEELAPHCRNIKKALTHNRLNIMSKVAPEQIEEEREKAKLEQKDMPLGPNFRTLFIQTEQSKFFNGSIRAIIRNSEGEYCCDYLMSVKKAIFGMHYFDGNGVKTKKNATRFLQCVISYCSNSGQLWWDKQIFNNNRATWLKNIFNFTKEGKLVFANGVHHLLLGYPDNSISDPAIKIFYDANLLSYILDKKQNFYWRNNYGGALFICYTSSGVLFSRQARDNFIRRNLIGRKDFRMDCSIPGSNWLWGFDIYFDYHSIDGNWYRFYWDRNKTNPPSNMTQFYTELELMILNKNLHSPYALK